MTAAEMSALLVDTVRDLSAARRESESWRIFALVAIGQAAELRRELEMIDSRNYVHRTRTQDERDVWLDHTDLRRADRAA